MGNRIDTEALRASISLSSVIGQFTVLKRQGRQLMGRCPLHDDSRPSMSVSDELGVFNCFGCGAKGDVFDFLMQHLGVDFLGAVTFLEGGSFPYAPPPASAQGAKGDTCEAARKIWDSGRDIHGSVAETYLRGRGLFLNELPSLPALRFARLPYKGGLERHPALVSAVRNCAGELTGIQRTFLTEDGRKLAVDEPKMSLGSIKGGAIQLGDFRAEIVAVEGLEDGLSVLRDVPHAAVWVAAGAGMLASLQLPAACRKVTIAADNDDTGRRAAEFAANAFQKAGRSVHIMWPSLPHKDFNAQIMSEAFS